MSRPGLSPAQVDELVDLHFRGVTNREIARLLSVNECTVSTWLMRRGLRSKQDRPGAPSREELAQRDSIARRKMPSGVSCRSSIEICLNCKKSYCPGWCRDMSGTGELKP